jgi:hypothetical protein
MGAHFAKVKSFYLMTNVALVEQLRNPRTRATFAFDPPSVPLLYK